MELKDTVNLMLSDDWRDRLKAEWLQVKIRHERLIGFIEAADQGKTNYRSEEGRAVLKSQRDMMANYMTVLEWRMKDAGIEFEPYTAE
ncbi:MAG: hypothetical protein IJ410_03445 [Oscillospiraceae bacterium]|nr:hypothetical protein [Oscillospiraceae bacterium]